MLGPDSAALEHSASCRAISLSALSNDAKSLLTPAAKSSPSSRSAVRLRPSRAARSASGSFGDVGATAALCTSGSSSLLNSAYSWCIADATAVAAPMSPPRSFASAIAAATSET